MRHWKWVLVCLLPSALVLAAACGEDSPGIPELSTNAADASTNRDGGTGDGATDARPGEGGTDPESDAAVEAGGDAGSPVLLFDTPWPGAAGRRLFIRGTEVFWQYDVGAKSYIATGSGNGGARTDIVEASTLISASDVREVLVYQAGSKLFTRPATAALEAPLELDGAGVCTAVTSSTSHVFCRAKNDMIVRWPKAGGIAETIASAVPEGSDLVTDDDYLYLGDTVGNAVARMPVSGFLNGGPPAPPRYRVLSIGQNNPHDLAIAFPPGDHFIYWSVDGAGNGGRIRGTSTDGGLTGSAGNLLSALGAFAPYSSSPARAYAALGDAGAPGSIVLVRFGQITSQPFHRSEAGVADMASSATAIYWLDGSARVWRAAPAP